MKVAFRLFGLLILLLCMLMPFSLNAQPYPCKDDSSCQGQCQADGVTCWNIDDPVPVDNSIIMLVAAGLIFGVYRLGFKAQYQS